MKLTIATTFLALVATTAFAADAVEDIPAAPVAAAPTFTWSGPYLGIDGGASWLNGDFSVGGASDSQDFNGGVFGGFVGYNFQFDNNFVVGIEGNFEHNWNEEEALGADVGTDWAGAVRGRVGYAFDRALLYGAAGWTATRGYVDLPGLDKETETFNGYTVGAGVDFAITNNIFARGEYRFNDFGEKDILGVDVDLDQHELKFGIGVKF
ncbi:outer membrane beta-barrel protein [Rhizobium leguminosarum bv. viciae]|uniref:Outer membrane beta-barrel protein n=1 Tax=Rhizobium leguminosarum bv. viciae TaxID=387 RepID=A0A8I2KMA2_RHILV|nr:outer membrane protein [Rhizobium leguminosarum]MBY5558768.1 porin family protein [Rhizobium leguminosarum]MBY5633218.1 porin family protein [Rhizobium leguminosarum]MBY5687932.1 porin family protein [Rhizobium leguminosarum]MBY5726852.1 porin family protein [Rhizobium leguminosarum]MBY5742448.1 porin family protein [Rhizobium leguminosarum]